MLLSLSWLKDFVKIPNSFSPEEVGQKLTLHTVEVEGIIDEAEKYKKVVVGKILEVKKHPNADRLNLAKVDVGNKKLDIVCGAPNIKEGQLVPVALVGAILPNGIEIKEAEVRGEKSQGMLCAQDELGLSDDHEGILILNKKAKVGELFAKYLGVDDIVLEVDNKSLSNRPDLWSHYGMARELSVLLESKFLPFKKVDLEKSLKVKGKERDLKIEVKDDKLCPRYMAITISGIEIKDSPKWLQDRLIAVGSRPVNNIVDITNYVMLELGQPLHAFDSSLVDEIIVRRAKKEEKLKTLDGEERKLDDSMLVIADSKKPIAVAGVMGGKNSEVSDNTSAIVLESANFDPVSVRKTANKLSLRTEASTRFEKSLDPNLAEMALVRALELIQKVCPKSKVASELSDVKNFSLDQGPILLNLDWLNNKIGEKIEEKRVVEILDKLGFEIEVKKGKEDVSFIVKVPTWRATKDVSTPEDLAEEIARVYGYNKIKSSLPEIKMEFPRFNEERKFEREIKNILSRGAKLSEVYNYSFVGEDQLTKIDIKFDSHVRLANPMTNNHALLRQSLVPNLLENVKLNQAKYDDIKIFEIGSVYFSFAGELRKDTSSENRLPHQEKRLSILLSKNKSDNIFAEIKGVVEYLFNYFGFECVFETAEELLPWAYRGASIKINDKIFGTVSLFNPKLVSKIGVKKSVAIAEINFNDFYSLFSTSGDKKYEESAKFPPVVRDLAFVVNKKVLYNNVKQEIENFDDLVYSAELFDVYEGEKLGRNKRNLAFHINYQADRTLTGEEIDQLQKKLSKHLEKKLGAQIRDF